MTGKELQRKFQTVIWITLSWSIISVIQLAYELSILEENNFEYKWVTSGDFLTYYLINTLSFLLNGFIAGVFIVFFLLDWIRNRSYNQGIAFGVLSYTILFFTLTCIQMYFVVSSIFDGSGSFFNSYFDGLGTYFLSYEFIRIFTFWLFMLVATVIVLLVNDKYGPGVFKKVLLGKYFVPVTEERIFMFLDLKGSTAIAEKLGEKEYFRFLQTVFKDITGVILERKAEVYQYVGDEVVLTWTKQEGVKELRCIRCFQDINSLLIELKNQYSARFGVVPEFKAGIHLGFATVGEIGVIKRDIAYSGDVLNTTARIQAKCNDIGVNLLFSKALFESLPSGNINPQEVGEVSLRGKSGKHLLYTI